MKKWGKKGMEIIQQNNAIVDEIARRIAQEAPTLADLGTAELKKIARAVVFDELKDDLRRKADAARIDYAKEKAVYLKNACRSEGTARVYALSLSRLDDWCRKNERVPMELTPRDADDFIYALAAEGRSAASVRLDVSAASAFFTWMERRHKSIRNPFRGTRARPKREARKILAIPSAEEMGIIENAFSEKTAAAVFVMARVGLRVGALPSLVVRDGRFTCVTKGKEFRGILPPEVLKALKKYGARPFEDRTAGGIAESVKYGIKRLFKDGKIAARYSPHDFRHYFAVEEYRKDRDIFRVSQLLGHSNIAITQTYLRGLGIDAAAAASRWVSTPEDIEVLKRP